MKQPNIRRGLYFVVVAALIFAGGCQTRPTDLSTVQGETDSDIVLQEGDVLSISFPGASSLDVSSLAIRRDGKITLAMVGEVAAAGLTPNALQEKLAALYSKQVLSKEVVVTVMSSSFTVYVDGATLHPGKITADHPITVLEAIMDAGGFDYSKADTKRVVVIRHKNGETSYDYNTLNLQLVIDGKRRDLFFLAPGDIVHVPEKFSWF